MKDHLDRLLDALDAEKTAREQEHARLRALSLADRAGAGFTLYPLDLVRVEHRSRGRVNALLRGQELHDGIAPGDAVVLAPLTRPDEGWAARCEGVDDTQIELRVDSPPEGKGPWAVSHRVDHTLLDLEAQALRKARTQWSPLKNLLLGYEPPYLPDPLDHPALAALPPSQHRAASLALGATELGLVHGPPGTGKTEVLVAMLAALVELGDRPWALAESNAGVDHLALSAFAAGLDVVRLGVSPRVGSRAAHLTLEHRILHGARAAVIEGLLKQASRVGGEELLEVQEAIREEWQAAKREILESAQVVATTLTHLHTRGGDLRAPRTAVVDEAGQVSEPSVWLLAGRVKRVVLAGDPQQLGPAPRSRHPLLEQSLLDRLVKAGFHFPMLTEQHRMNDAIAAAVNPTYGGRLTTPPHVGARTVAELGVGPSPWAAPPLRFLDTASSGADEAPDGRGGFENPREVELLVHVWASLHAAGLAPEHVGVITPYAAQVARLRAALPGLEVGTVPSWQGREKEVILASFVRSNPDGELGPVGDTRRLNVTLSRARRLFVGVGDSATLGASAEFRRLLDVAAEGGGYTSVWELEGV